MIPTPQMTNIRIEPLTTLAQFDLCVELQNEIWAYDLSGMMTQKVFLLASEIGGQVIGAFEGTALIGYSMSLPGYRNGHAYLHSHHLAVTANWRNAGVGRALKLAQRDDAIARGFDLIEWTFDPLEIKNAHFNFSKLGAISRRYRENFYGPSTSPLHGGLPTDRIYAEWWLNSDRVRRVLGGAKPVAYATEVVTVPAAVSVWKSDDETRGKARQVQAANAEALKSAFAGGLAVIGYERSPEGDGRFLLGEWNEGLAY